MSATAEVKRTRKVEKVEYRIQFQSPHHTDSVLWTDWGPSDQTKTPVTFQNTGDAVKFIREKQLEGTLRVIAIKKVLNARKVTTTKLMF